MTLENNIKALNGYWIGSSSNSQSTTLWQDTYLEFIYCNNTSIVEIKGTGNSLWRNKVVDFDLTGRIDWDKKTFEIVKQHKGQYTNKVSYAGVIDIDSLLISGTYENGYINLSKLQGKLKE